jgi:hypothetical protein
MNQKQKAKSGLRKKVLTMAEYIDREKAIETARLNYCKNCNSINGIRCRGCGFDDAMLELESVPSADVVEVVHGEWVNYKAVHYKCSICGNRVGGKITKYCSECGAKMDGDKNG